MKYLQVLTGLFLFALTVPNNTNAQTPKNRGEQGRLPIIDMHAHCYPNPTPEPLQGAIGTQNEEQLYLETVKEYRKWNVVKAVIGGYPELVEVWKSRDEDDRIIPGIYFNPGERGMTPERIESMVKAGEVKVCGEIQPMLRGTTLCDPEWEPYLRICEKYDIPVSIHAGAGAPWIHQNDPKVLASLGDPYLIEPVLKKYKLRVYLSHAGFEYYEHTLMLMALFPDLYVDLGASLWVHPYCKRLCRLFLEGAKESELLDRVMFGSDQMSWPHAISLSIEYLNSLEFLSDQDKRDILYNNAARFLRLKEHSKQEIIVNEKTKIAAIDTHAHVIRALEHYSKVSESEKKLYSLSVKEKAKFLLREMSKAETAMMFLMGKIDSSADDPLGIQENLEIGALIPGIKVIGAADPRKGLSAEHMSAAKAQLEEHRKDIVALKCYLGYLGGPEDPGYQPYYILAQECNLPVIFHTGDTWGAMADLKLSHPLDIDRIAWKYPNLRIVMAHVGVPWHREACQVAWKNDNVWLDLSGLLLADDKDTNHILTTDSLPDAVPGLIISDLLNALTYMSKYDRLLYATDLGPISCSLANYRRFIERIIPKEHHDKVFRENAENLFGVDIPDDY